MFFIKCAEEELEYYKLVLNILCVALICDLRLKLRRG